MAFRREKVSRISNEWNDRYSIKFLRSLRSISARCAQSPARLQSLHNRTDPAENRLSHYVHEASTGWVRIAHRQAHGGITIIPWRAVINIHSRIAGVPRLLTQQRMEDPKQPLVFPFPFPSSAENLRYPITRDYACNPPAICIWRITSGNTPRVYFAGD